MILNDFKCCCKLTTYILMKVLDFDILPKNVFNQSECRFSELQYSRNNGLMKLIDFHITRNS